MYIIFSWDWFEGFNGYLHVDGDKHCLTTYRTKKHRTCHSTMRNHPIKIIQNRRDHFAQHTTYSIFIIKQLPKTNIIFRNRKKTIINQMGLLPASLKNGNG